ncbi:hypothetical protein [Tenacibaculum sp. IB213877]|uniref:toxin-antitoxin system YwqK family antitoxin n=1 Tax=Tenacibaculum sp. IB213877 TaxID=3097351 RepID=UPI002A5A59C1|nr:hypothetical protein [Tenacibaculum sp. IB213877]MDY0781087.1 hypothetical protein [Tenacibaculum sp. IB213877]
MQFGGSKIQYRQRFSKGQFYCKGFKKISGEVTIKIFPVEYRLNVKNSIVNDLKVLDVSDSSNTTLLAHYKISGNTIITYTYKGGKLDSNEETNVISDLQACKDAIDKLKTTECYYHNGKVNIKCTYDENGKENGLWEYFYENGQLSVSQQYVHGKRDGKNINYYENGTLQSSGDYLHGERNGNWKYYDKNGTLTEDVNYDNGELISSNTKPKENNESTSSKVTNGGLYTQIVNNAKESNKPKEIKEYYDNGQLKAIGFKNINGKLQGELKTYYENGQLKSIDQYKDGVIYDKLKGYHKNGNLFYEGNITNGIVQIVYYRENGKKQTTGKFNFTNKTKIGEWKYYDQNGSLSQIKTYKNGKEISTKKVEQKDYDYNIFGGISSSRVTKKDWEAVDNYKNNIKLMQSVNMEIIKDISSYFGKDDTETYYFQCYRDRNTDVLFIRTKFKKDKVYFKGRYVYDVMYELQIKFSDVISVEERGNTVYFNLNSNGFNRRTKVPGENWTQYFQFKNDFQLTIYNSEKRKEALKAFKYLAKHPYKKN